MHAHIQPFVNLNKKGFGPWQLRKLFLPFAFVREIFGCIWGLGCVRVPLYHHCNPNFSSEILLVMPPIDIGLRSDLVNLVFLV